jgi:hypothetical protein
MVNGRVRRTVCTALRDVPGQQIIAAPLQQIDREEGASSRYTVATVVGNGGALRQMGRSVLATHPAGHASLETRPTPSGQLSSTDSDCVCNGDVARTGHGEIASLVRDAPGWRRASVCRESRVVPPGETGESKHSAGYPSRSTRHTRWLPGAVHLALFAAYIMLSLYL